MFQAVKYLFSQSRLTISLDSEAFSAESQEI